MLCSAPPRARDLPQLSLQLGAGDLVRLPDTVSPEVRDSRLRDKQKIQQYLNITHRTDKPLLEDGEETEQKGGADPCEQCFKAGYQTPEGAGQSLQAVWTHNEPAAVQHHPGCHPVRCLWRHQRPAWV